jgi:cytochrome c
MIRTASIAVAVGLALSVSAAAQPHSGEPARGEQVFQACAACHSLAPDKNLTGPSLAGLWGRKAGGLASFKRYSPALQSSGVAWDDKSLDAWLKDPQHFLPGNAMTFPGIKDERQRADLLAYLREVTQPGKAPPQRPGGMAGMGRGMMGMMGGGEVPNLKKPTPQQLVRSIRHCGDGYTVATADGQTRVIWERNLRLKTDSSGDGPEKGAPALVPAGMMGDRFDVIFAAPDEISAFVGEKC